MTGALCSHPGCGNEPVVKIGRGRYCSVHAEERQRHASEARTAQAKARRYGTMGTYEARARGLVKLGRELDRRLGAKAGAIIAAGEAERAWQAAVAAIAVAEGLLLR